MVFQSSPSTLRSVAATVALLALGSVSAGNPGNLATQSSPTTSTSEDLCSLVPGTYARAKLSHPEIAYAISEVEKHSIATWFTDREANGDYAAIAQKLVDTCPSSSRLSVVVYGIPNKDCEAGYSASGSRVQNAADYVKFLDVLMAKIQNRKVLYVLEPDAVGLLAKDGGCGEEAGYRANLKTAIDKLSQNPNAEIYLDVGYWSLAYPEPTQRAVEVVKDLVGGGSSGGRVKGITLNTSNYRTTKEIAALCTNFQHAMGSAYQMNCIVDTSRNYVGSPSTEWCNVGAAGIGQPPTAATGVSNLDYFLWIKPPGESDGPCDGSDHTPDAMRGPAPGDFFVDGFKKLWDHGYFVDAKHMAKTDGSNAIHQTSAPVGTPVPAPTATMEATPTPEVTTATPSPEVTTGTPTPAPEATTSTPSPTAAVTTMPPVPEVTTVTPWSSAPSSSPTIPTTETPAPSETVAPPSATPQATPAPSGSSDSPPVAPVVTPTITSISPSAASSSSSSSSSLSSAGSSTGSDKPTRPPTIDTPAPAPKPTTTSKPTETSTAPPSSPSSPWSDVAQNAGTPVINGGPTAAPVVNATTKSGDSTSSFTGGIIAAALIGAVALAVAAAMVVHVRRRTRDAAADDMKTPHALETAQPAYLSQL